MNQQSTGAYPPGYSTGDDSSTARQVAEQARQSAGDVKDTATEQAQRVGRETRNQARKVVADARAKMGEQARSQNDKLVGSIRQTADHLDEMRVEHRDTPAAAVVSRVADGGRQLADYLDRNGPEGVLQEVQDFARRRPGAFLATALVARFVVGRLGKGVAKADPDAGKPASDAFASTGNGNVAPTPDYSAYADPAPAGYPSSTEYAATGTGTPSWPRRSGSASRSGGHDRPEFAPARRRCVRDLAR